MHLEAKISLRFGRLTDALGSADCRSLIVNLKAVIEQIWRYTWRPQWTYCYDAHVGLDKYSVECTWRPTLSGLKDAHGVLHWTSVNIPTG